jgi:hypothetical protein
MSVVNAGLVALPSERPGFPTRPTLCGHDTVWIYTNFDQFVDAPLSLVLRFRCTVDGRPYDYTAFQRVIQPGRFPYGRDLEVVPPPL